MAVKNPPIEIVSLAQSLGLGAKTNPYNTIVDFCEKRVKEYLDELGNYDSLSTLLEWVANKLSTEFVEIHNDQDLQAVKEKYCNKGEKAFANIENELAGEVYGITYRLLSAKDWEKQYVSIIDCRGEKAFRSYFTKWHEISHLLTLTDQGRLIFRRTHKSISGNDSEENLMDIIAGRIGFYDGIFHRHIENEISFDEIERLRELLCPDASQQASIINFIKYWNSPCIHLELRLGLNKEEKNKQNQRTFDFVDSPEQVLRAVRTSPNEEARKINFALFRNMRVPQKSIIHKIYEDNSDYGEATENLILWNGQNHKTIKVKVRNCGDYLEALIIPY